MSIEKRMSLAGRPAVIRRGGSGKVRVSGNGWSMEVDGSAYDLSEEDKFAITDMVDSYLASIASSDDKDNGR